ncbi:MAG TPA: hypothetical protein VIB39_15660 [Candidatus Angelobacter sp.]|jgi:hypothetical protein
MKQILPSFAFIYGNDSTKRGKLTLKRLSASSMVAANRYLAALTRFVAGTIPFDDSVSKSLIPLPSWVDLHYELTNPGAIEYDFRFDYKVLLPVLAYGLARVAADTYLAITELEWGTAVLVDAY